MCKIRLILFVAFFPLFLMGQKDFAGCEKAKKLYQVLKKEHYAPKQLDDKLSEQIYDKFIDFLDDEGYFFLSTDIDSLKQYRNQLDDEIMGGSCKFLFEISSLLKKRLLLADSLITTILDQPFDFQKDEMLVFDEQTVYKISEKELKEKWRKTLKYNTLIELHDLQVGDTLMLNKDSFLANEEWVRNIVKTQENRRIDRMLNHPYGFEKYILYIYLNSIAMCFDPHTMYFSMNELKSLESALSDEVLSFGIELAENKDGNLQISKLIPGGPAWKTNMLNKGDILLKMKWEGGEEIDLKYADIYEISYEVRNVNDKSLLLTVQKLNGAEIMVKLIKEKIQADENIVKSFVLNGEKRVGYIALPSFYTEWENEELLGCANDVAKEILKLRKEDIEGLVLDLRDNGGGSMSEAIGLAGIFIDAGPLAIYHMRDDKPRSLKDINRGTIYDGPLVFLVNGQSASASEILAAAMQDLNRAVIVGSKTFGKSTGQTIMPMDTLSDLTYGTAQHSKMDDFVKVTNTRFYRIPGSTYQLEGVIPDIVLPVIKSGYEYSESSYDYTFQNDSIVKKMYYTPFPELPISELKENSEVRVGKNSYFGEILTINNVIEKHKAIDESISLNLEIFLKEEGDYDLFQDVADTNVVTDTLYSVAISEFDVDLYEMDDYRDEIMNNIINAIESDPYIREAYQIICDIFMLNKN